MYPPLPAGYLHVRKEENSKSQDTLSAQVNVCHLERKMNRGRDQGRKKTNKQKNPPQKSARLHSESTALSIYRKPNQGKKAKEC